MAFRPRQVNTSFLTTINPKLGSTGNTFELTTTSTNEDFEKTGTLKAVNLQEGAAIVGEIVDDIFKKEAGFNFASSSQCSSVSNFKADFSEDARLQHWEDELDERKTLERKILRKTGKKPNDVLFNRQTTIDNRNKRTVQRIMDYADRMCPTQMSQMKTSKLKEYFDTERCMYVQELQETLPQAEKDGKVDIEISGIPKATQREIIGEEVNQYRDEGRVNRTKWLHSRVLHQRIDHKRGKIKQVLEHFPDFDNLQVIGTIPADFPPTKKDPCIKCVEKIDLCQLSGETESLSEEDNELVDYPESTGSIAYEPMKATPEVAIKINGILCTMDEKPSSLNVDFNVYFQCEPYQRVAKTILTLENIGKSFFTCSWQKCLFYPKSPFLHLNVRSFVMKDKNFMLRPGCKREIVAMYAPNNVEIAKSKWILRMFPYILCSRPGIILKLHGKCVAPNAYSNLIDKKQKDVLDKSIKKCMDKLATMHGQLVPLLQPHEIICPYERIFDEREIFNEQNKIYMCERFDDLEQLKSLYKRLKKPREHPWDLKIDTLKKLIMRQDDADQREAALAELNFIVKDMGSSKMDLLSKFEHNTERDRSRFIYVRGIIGNGIDEWETLVFEMETKSMKLERQRFYAKHSNENAEEVAEEDEDSEANPLFRKLKYEQPEAYLERKLQHAKFYQDSMFILTYTHLCEIIENIVSVIESTEYV